MRKLFRNKLYINNIMSANRSVQAAQRRRAGPSNDSIPGRGPQPSINSSQMFSNQSRPGQQPSRPGQHPSIQQNQKLDGLAGLNKMTIPQAITLITLRLGALESKVMNINELQDNNSQDINIEGQENMIIVDKTVFQSITSRLDSLEKRSSGAGSSAGPEVNLLKQQFETVKQAVVQTKGATSTLIKENKDLKTQLDALNRELNETKELLNALQNLTMDNSQKIMEISVNMSETINDGTFDENMLDSITQQELSNLHEDNDEQNEIIGNNLKEIIESEINAESDI
jgi:hypothetical protein